MHRFLSLFTGVYTQGGCSLAMACREIFFNGFNKWFAYNHGGSNLLPDG
jgi:hypothetical protein